MRQFARTRLHGWILAAVGLLVSPQNSRAADTAIPSGSGQIAIQSGPYEIQVFTYMPEAYRDGPLVVVCHGMQRNADEYRDKARGLADRMGAIVAAPLFDLARFPIEAYQLGGVFKAGELQPAETWTISLVGKLADAIRQRTGNPKLPYYLIGHSAGGQFLTRLAALTVSGSRRIVMANPGTHLFPTRDLPFPHGFGNLPEALSDDAALRRYLAQPITVYLGTADLGDVNLSKTATAMKQGASRYERGQNCFRLAAELAEKNGWPINWRLVEAPDVAHDVQAMFDHANALEALLGQ